MEISPTPRAYSLKLCVANSPEILESLWITHCTVNACVRAWGNWLLTLRGGLSPTLAESDSSRRVLLALSWLSVESPESLISDAQVIASGAESADERTRKVHDRFRHILGSLNVSNTNEWFDQCAPALSARIRRDAFWVDRFSAFEKFAKQTGLDRREASTTLLDLLGGEKEYFAMPDDDSPALAEAKDFVIKAGNWLSANWGSGEKSDPSGIGDQLVRLTQVEAGKIVGNSGRGVLNELCAALGLACDAEATAEQLLKHLKQTVGWKGRSSKGAVALQRLLEAEVVNATFWSEIQAKLGEEAADQQAKAGGRVEKGNWIDIIRKEIEQKTGMPFRTSKDHIWEYAVAFDHALRRVSGAHSWIKRAEVSRRTFDKNVGELVNVPESGICWLDEYCKQRTSDTDANDSYLIRRRAIDAWNEIVHRWSHNDCSSREKRIAAARELQSAPEIEKFGDIQLFEALADDDAICVWRRDGEPDDSILRSYVLARQAASDRVRFKVPAYRHPDALRHPVFVDFGNSRWGISYSVLDAVHKRESLKIKLATAKTDTTREKIKRSLESPYELRCVTLGLWAGAAIDSKDIPWRSHRLEKDLDFAHFMQDGPLVPRADRFGRLSGRTPKDAVRPEGIFNQKEWNGRLQAPREKLEGLGRYLAKHNFDIDRRETWNGRALKLWQHLGWFLSYSAKLQPSGPWIDFVEGLPKGWEYRKSRSGEYYLNKEADKGRGRRARLKLARLSGLRLLSVDLGERYAAACAVWETLSIKAMEAECSAAGNAPPKPGDLFLHLRHPTDKVQKSGRRKGEPVTETTIYRRIAADALRDGSAHPAPWARLDRQFLIKLQGEEQSPRKPNDPELKAVNEFRQKIGLDLLSRSADNRRRNRVPTRVDELMLEATGLARQALRQLGDCARTAYKLTATSKPTLARGTIPLKTRDDRIEYLQEALIHWQTLVHARDEWASQKWEAIVVAQFGGPQPVAIDDDASRSERKKQIEQSHAPLRKVAEQLVDQDNSNLSRQWTGRWDERKEEIRLFLRWLRRWIFPRGKDKWSKSIRHVGGVGYMRQAAMRGLYQTLKAYRMRPEPNNLQENIPEAGDESLDKFGQRILDALDRLRENRVKQLASRIVEGALGAGTENREQWESGRRRPRVATDSKRHNTCHAVVVEDLEHYRPEQTRTRRENRGLMNWAARNLRKRLMEGCELNGLFFEEVSPRYTSRQDSRTGAPGVRCHDVPVGDFQDDKNGELPRIVKGCIKRILDDKGKNAKEALSAKLARAQEAAQRCEGLAFDRYVLALHSLLREQEETSAELKKVRIPHEGGKIFVCADEFSPTANGLQADLNAAANIGLRALLDPDWSGAWWYVPVNSETGRPADDCAGSQAMPEKLFVGQTHESSPTQSKKRKRNKEILNLFSFLSADAIAERTWATYSEFWSGKVEYRVLQLLREKIGLPDEKSRDLLDEVSGLL